MRLRNILDLALLYIGGFFLAVKFSGFGRVIGFLFIAAGVILTVLLLKDKGFIKSRREKRKEQDAAEKREKVKKLQKYDVDSGLGYCSFCGNYGVNSEKICESCGEKAID